MKRKFRQIVPLLLITIVIASCSNKPDDASVKKIIADYEKQEMTKFSNILVHPCGFAKSIRVPKSIKIAIFPTRPDMTAIFQNQKTILDGFSLQKIIQINYVQETSGYNSDGIQGFSKEYSINLDPSAENIKLGETADEYVLPLFDLNNIEILNENSKGNDTIEVIYKLKELPTYEVLKQNCSIAKDNYLVKNDSSRILIIKDGKNWKCKD
jgi:hypothetical protein